MLKTGSVPVSDQIQRVPAVPAGDSKSCYLKYRHSILEADWDATVKGKAPVAAEDDEEEELRKLQAEMAM